MRAVHPYTLDPRAPRGRHHLLGPAALCVHHDLGRRARVHHLATPAGVRARGSRIRLGARGLRVFARARMHHTRARKRTALLRVPWPVQHRKTRARVAHNSKTHTSAPAHLIRTHMHTHTNPHTPTPTERWRAAYARAHHVTDWAAARAAEGRCRRTESIRPSAVTSLMCESGRDVRAAVHPSIPPERQRTHQVSD